MYLVKNIGTPIVHCLVIFLALPILDAFPTLRYPFVCPLAKLTGSKGMLCFLGLTKEKTNWVA